MYLQSARRWIKRLADDGINAYITPGPRKARNGQTLARITAFDREGQHTILRSETSCRQFQERYSSRGEGTDTSAETTEHRHRHGQPPGTTERLCQEVAHTKGETSCRQLQERFSSQAEGTDAAKAEAETVHWEGKHNVGANVAQRRIYADPAERMRAYRQRRKERESGAANPGTPRRWIRELNDVQQSMRAYYLARTERWRESDRGETLDDILGKLEDVIADLEAM